MNRKTMKEWVIYVFPPLGYPDYIQAAGKISGGSILTIMGKDKCEVIEAVKKGMLLHKMYGADKAALVFEGKFHPPDSFFRTPNPFNVVYTSTCRL